LFKSWDVDGDDSISENELVKPLVSLGLAPDHKFAKKLCNALVPIGRVHQSGVEL
jgi:Ca2+-binding EF-hand superfamily protein